MGKYVYINKWTLKQLIAVKHGLDKITYEKRLYRG